MQDLPQETLGLVAAAGASVIEAGVLGALLVLSVAGNVALVIALVRCWRFHRGGVDHDAFR